MNFVISAKFPGTDRTQYLMMSGKFDHDFERAWQFESVEEAEAKRSEQRFKSWSRVENGRRVQVVPTYELVCV